MNPDHAGHESNVEARLSVDEEAFYEARAVTQNKVRAMGSDELNAIVAELGTFEDLRAFEVECGSESFRRAMK